MKKLLFVVFFLILTKKSLSMQVSSSSFRNKGQIPQRVVFNSFGCHGQNISPQLAWKNFPKETKSFAIMVHDEDAPTGGSGWWHWSLFNIPANITEIGEGVRASDISSITREGRTDFGSEGFGGPCPPKGERHKYSFTVYALNIPNIQLKGDETPAMIGLIVNAHQIDRATLIGYYKR